MDLKIKTSVEHKKIYFTANFRKNDIFNFWLSDCYCFKLDFIDINVIEISAIKDILKHGEIIVKIVGYIVNVHYVREVALRFI